MYLLFREKNWAPAQYWARPAGEKALVRAFLVRELEQREEAMRQWSPQRR